MTLILPKLIRVTLKDGKMPAFVRWTIPCTLKKKKNALGGGGLHAAVMSSFECKDVMYKIFWRIPTNALVFINVILLRSYHHHISATYVAIFRRWEQKWNYSYIVSESVHN